ncbi:hypothetical protein MKZ21_30820 [Paenibacillus sp. FSL P2-0536]|uniref:hypothetical protein n=1 Tax=Paenibacillus sp. FSL P2-0536 TaxID=2921629 RepID=UPI0030FA2B83
MTKTIKPEPITKSQAAALEAIRQLPEFKNESNILDAHASDPKGWGMEYSALNEMEYRQLRRVLKYGYTTEIRVKRIVIIRGEGPIKESERFCEASSWEEANEILKSMAITAPDSGYHKTLFTIWFTNGDTYSGTYELTKADRIHGDLYKHVTDHCEFFGGVCKKLPDHIKSEEYQGIIENATREYLLLLDDLIYPSAGVKGVNPELLQRCQPIEVPKEKMYQGTLLDKLTLQVSKDLEDRKTYTLYKGFSRFHPYTNLERLETWLKKMNLKIGESIRENTYEILGAYRISMVPRRAPFLHLPQIVIKMNGSMVRAYKEVTSTVTNIYVVMNYPEQFHFDYSTPSGQWYLKKFFWD